MTKRPENTIRAIAFLAAYEVLCKQFKCMIDAKKPQSSIYYATPGQIEKQTNRLTDKLLEEPVAGEDWE